ncbi:MAG: hypothetical protein KJ941_05765 [Bacteroidetes bacterium]|nr:hypothetical protein [Bacteroidota bacterium]
MSTILNNIKQFKLAYPRLFFATIWLIIFALCILIRLPHFLSRNFFFDGDEAIVGIMGQDWLNLRAFPTYFYGQNYGFCVFEVWAVAFWLKLVGTGAWALRLGGLTLYSLGIALVFYGQLKRGIQLKYCIIFLFIFASFPAWYMWGAMVRGGYVMAFAAVAAIYYLFSFEKWNWGRILTIGLLAAIAFESHVLLLIPIAPLFLSDWVKNQFPWKKMTWVLVSFVVSVFLIKASDQYFNGWSSPKLMLHYQTFTQAYLWNFEHIVEIFGGFYFYNVFIDIPLWWKVGLIVLLLLYLILISFSNSKENRWVFVLWLLAMFGVVTITGFFGVYSPRYLLGFFMSILFFCLYFFTAHKWSFRLIGFIAIVQLIGIFAGSKLKREWYPNNQNQLEALDEIHETVVKNGKKAVMITDNLGQWQWNYMYGQQIPATAFRRKERVMNFTEEVYKIYDNHPDDVAIIGLWGVFWSMDSIPGFNDHRIQVAEKYYYMDYNLPYFIDKGESVAR